MQESIQTNFKCHQISQVLLKQFTKNKKLKTIRLDGLIELHRTKYVGYVFENKALYQVTEAKWQKIENHFENVLKVVESGNVLNDQSCIKTLKQLIALHLVRSNSTQDLFSKLAKEEFEKLISENKNPNLNTVEFREGWKTDLEKLKLEGIIHNLEKVQKFIDTYYLQIAKAPSNANFVLGDSPVINLILEGPSGIIQGVKINESDAIFLPLSPKYIVSLTNDKSSSRYLNFSWANVRLINKKTKKQVIKEFYALPE